MNRRGFFRTIPAAAAAAVVAPAAVEAALTHQRHVAMSYISTARHVDKIWRLASGYGMGREKMTAAYMQPDPMFEMLPFKPVDSDWHIGMPRQAESRCHRKGQKPIVQVKCFAP
jgi:hypothetical protein